MGSILKILILGGTTFLGPYLVQELQEHRHEVSCSHEGIDVLNFLSHSIAKLFRPKCS
jgi:uncharacterized protein YbjT (DUF2867 family)